MQMHLLLFIFTGIPDTVMAVYTPATGKNAEGGSVEQLWQVRGGRGAGDGAALGGGERGPLGAGDGMGRFKHDVRWQGRQGSAALNSG